MRRRWRRLPLLSTRQWLRRIAFWVGALLVSFAAIAFAFLADQASAVFGTLTAGHAWLGFLIAPSGFALSVWLTRSVFPGAQGSGIPQVMAAMHMNSAQVNAVLSPRIAVGKVLLTLLGLASGASIGREGPTVQIGATIMHTFGRALRLPRQDLNRALVLAGGAAGVAAAFNTPLAGIVFAIEELSHSFERRASGQVLTAVIIAGITTVAMVGNYSYFGSIPADLAFGAGWLAVAVCGVAGGVLGGAFSSSLLWFARGVPGLAGRLIAGHPLAFAALCGLVVATIGWLDQGSTYGTGYAQARGLVSGEHALPAAYALEKFVASVASYVCGLPGGVFAPSLAVGAGLGQAISHVLTQAPTGAIVLLGMVGYFSGVVQAPITATIIVTEMTNNQTMTVPLLATAVLAYATSRLVCRRPLYATLAKRFLLASVH